MFRIAFLLLIITIAFEAHSQKEAPYDIKNPADKFDKKCERCLKMMKNKPIEVGFGVNLEGDDIYFVATNPDWFYELISDSNDGIAIDIVTKKQYDCGSDIRFSKSAIFRGYLLPPLYKKDIETRSTRSSEGWLLFKIATLPPHLKNSQVEFNVLFLDNKNLCYYQSFYKIDGIKWELLETGLFVDTLQNISEIDKSIILNKRFKFEIPFEKGKYEYAIDDIKPVYDSLRLYNYDIERLTIEAYTSVEGSREVNEVLQQKRANSIVTAIEAFQKHDIPKEIITAENWVEFFNDIKGTKYKEWGRLNKSAVKERLSDVNVMDRLEPILSSHRKAILYLNLQKKVDYHFESADKVVKLFEQAIESKDVEEAMEIQKSVYYHIKNNLLPQSLMDKLEVPETSLFGPVINNQIVYKYTFAPQSLYNALAEFEKLSKILPDNIRILYNMLALKLRALSYGDPLLKEEEILSDIKKLEGSDLNRNLVNRLKINYGIIKSEQLLLQRNYKEKNAMVKSIYDMYKVTELTAEDALCIAKYFVSYQQYSWAIFLLSPYTKKIDTSEDLLFYYINLTIINPKVVNSADYKTLLVNAVNKNRGRFCHLFNSFNDGGITFQLLSTRSLKENYCENCSDTNLTSN